MICIASERLHSVGGRAVTGLGITNVADERIPLVYDALRSERIYKAAMEHDRCVEIIEADRGTHFDPDAVDAFLRGQADFQWISTVLANSGPSTEIEKLEGVEPE